MKPYPTYLQSIGLLLMLIPSIALCVLVLIPFNLDVRGAITISIVYSVSLALTVAFGVSKRKGILFPLTGFPITMLLAAYAFVMCFHIISEPLTSLIPVDENLEKTFEEILQNPVLSFLVIAVLAALLEELLFRGIILDGYLKNYSPMASVLVSAFLFALIHGNLAQGLGAFVIGLVIGFCYWRTKSILFCISLHFANNATAWLSTLMGDWGTKPDVTLQEIIGNNSIYFMVYAVALTGVAGCGWYLWTTCIKPVNALLWAKPEIDLPPVVQAESTEI
ncbi:MAG: CPBP family intramembrane metalloprotease [Cyclobacteriaceae bacterium]|nr:CPBP family intramembrane metalloprotease [Cyclobacteriaceae bacterium]